MDSISIKALTNLKTYTTSKFGHLPFKDLRLIVCELKKVVHDIKTHRLYEVGGALTCWSCGCG